MQRFVGTVDALGHRASTNSGSDGACQQPHKTLPPAQGWCYGQQNITVSHFQRTLHRLCWRQVQLITPDSLRESPAIQFCQGPIRSQNEHFPIQFQ